MTNNPKWKKGLSETSYQRQELKKEIRSRGKQRIDWSCWKYKGRSSSMRLFPSYGSKFKFFSQVGKIHRLAHWLKTVKGISGNRFASNKRRLGWMK